MFHSKVTQKGQITIPAKIRKNLNISEGDIVHFISQDSETITLSVRKAFPLSALFGFLTKSEKILTIEEMQDVIEKSACNDRD